LTLADVRTLASLLQRESTALPSHEIDTPRLSFFAKCSDGSSFQSSDVALFSNDSVVARKRVESISMILSNYRTESKIEIALQHTEDNRGWYRNYASVEGTDSKWVNGNIKAIEEIIESFAPQDPVVLRHKWLVHTVLALGIGRLYNYLTYPLVGFFAPSAPHWVVASGLFFRGHPVAFYTLMYLSYYIAGFFPALYFFNKFQALWPSVEFQIGPEHSLIEKRRRLWLLNFFLVGVAPLLTSLAYDLLKPLFAFKSLSRDRLRYFRAIPGGTKNSNLLSALNHEYLCVYAGFRETMHSIMHWVFTLNCPAIAAAQNRAPGLYAKIGLLAATNCCKEPDA